MILSNKMTWKDIKDVLRKEFQFFDVLYFSSRSLSIIKMFFNGHGKDNGNMPLQKGYDMNYKALITEIVRMAN